MSTPSKPLRSSVAGSARTVLVLARDPLLRSGIAPVRHRGATSPVSFHRCRLPAGLEWAGRPGRLVIGLDKITTAAGFSFSPGGWHPHVETLRWIHVGHVHDPGDSPLARLYAVFQPVTVGEALFDDLSEPLPGLTDLPLVRGQLRELWNPYGARSGPAGGRPKPLDRPGLYWGPATSDYVVAEVRRTLAVHRSLDREGLMDHGPGKEAISGYLLVRGSDYRFVVHQGHHRLASLAALAYDSAPVYLSWKVPPVVDDRHLDRWTRGRRPRYTPAGARLLFTRLFESTGAEKARRLGLTGEGQRSAQERPAAEPPAQR